MSHTFKPLQCTVLWVLAVSVVVSACQQEPEPQPADERKLTSSAGTTTDMSTPHSAPSDKASSIQGEDTRHEGDKTDETKEASTPEQAVADKQYADAADAAIEDIAIAETTIQDAAVETGNTPPKPSPAQAITGKQVTDVHYRNDAGETMTVTFETSASGVLNAIVALPNRSKTTLSAPEGQGNNPTYRSSDGKTKLISHGGGSSIDLIREGSAASFEAISAEAEVITQP